MFVSLWIRVVYVYEYIAKQYDVGKVYTIVSETPNFLYSVSFFGSDYK